MTKVLPAKCQNIDTVLPCVVDERERTARRISKFNPNHLRILYACNSAYRHQYERDDDVKDERGAMVCNFSPMWRTPHESKERLGRKNQEGTYCSMLIHSRNLSTENAP